jgi:acyl carrier protein
MTLAEALNWIAKTFDESADRITPATARDEIAAWDSLGTLALMAGLDMDFGILLSDQEVQAMKTVNDILEVLKKNCKLSD